MALVRSIIEDCYGTRFRIIPSSTNGCCGYEALAFCLYGTHSQYADIVRDCIAVFRNANDLYRLRTNVGAQGIPLDVYGVLMAQAVVNVQNGRQINSELWCEDAHFVAIATLYDICIFIYVQRDNKWIAYNENGRSGYVCLLHTTEHFDTLLAADGGIPTIPHAVHTQCVSRRHIGISDDVWSSMQRGRALNRVSPWPPNHTGVIIVNQPIVTVAAALGSCSVPTEANDNASDDRCTFPTCSYTSKSTEAMYMHQLRTHGRRLHCNIAGCSYVAFNMPALRCHERNTHHQLNGDDTTGTAVSETISANKQQGLNGNPATVTKRTAEETISSSNKCGRFTCDVGDCRAEYRSSRWLTRHKLRCHGTDTEFTMGDAEPDTESMCIVDSSSPTMCTNQRLPNTQTEADHAPVSNHTRSNNSAREQFAGRCNAKAKRSTRKFHAQRSFVQEIKDCERDLRQNVVDVTLQDPLYDRLKAYHDNLRNTVSNTTTEKLSSEVEDVISDITALDECNRKYVMSKQDEKKLSDLTERCKLLQGRPEWTWAATDDSDRGKYNDQRMQLCITKELEWCVIECPQCECTGLLVGDQTDSSVCRDCMTINSMSQKHRQEREDAWRTVKPVSKNYPKGTDGRDLPDLQPGDKAVLAPVHPVVTIKKNSYAEKRMQIQSITLLQEPLRTWCRILPRTSLEQRFIIIERRVQDARKYIVACPDRVRLWLRYLFTNHHHFILLQNHNQLELSEAAIDDLGPDVELAEVDSSLAECSEKQARQKDSEIQQNDDGLIDATVESGLAETHVFSYDRYPELYLKSKEILRVRQEGKLEIIQDETIRRPTYCCSPNLAFPYLYPHGEKSPVDCHNWRLGKYLMKKQALFALRKNDGTMCWPYNDDIHMAHLYAKLHEQTIRATVGYYVSAHPSIAHMPVNNIISAFRDGVDHQSGLLESRLPDLTKLMAQLPNSRQHFYQERLGIETISRDLGAPNLFLTVNLDPRASSDVRRLLYRLERGQDMPREEPFQMNTAEFTNLLNKHATFVEIYLNRKVKILMKTFFTEICGIEMKESINDWSQRDLTEIGYFWGRVEFTETRGICHFHYLVKLPHVLDTGLLGRIIHNGRVVRRELKHGNVKPDKIDKAWEIVEAGLLASRYVSLFAHSISQASFYTEDVDIDSHDDDKVIKLEPLRQEFARNYKDRNVNLTTHPIMRRFDDNECDPNKFIEMARVCSVSCIHQCLKGSCGGDKQTGDGCRFDFPKKKLKYTVPAVMQVNAHQMEARVLLRRSCDRVANVNRYLVRYLRSNHDASVLIDSAHKLRYATKYCSKQSRHAVLLDEMIEHLNKRSSDLLPPNTKQVLTSLLLADCSHRVFMSKQELAYKVMCLPEISRSFAQVEVVGFYHRANVNIAYDDDTTIEYSDRTIFSCYAERLRTDTVLRKDLHVETLQRMCYSEFAETVQGTWIKNKDVSDSRIEGTQKHKFRSRDVNAGYWVLTLRKKRHHIRPSTVLYTAPAIDYEFVEHAKTTTQTTFFDLQFEKRNQLYRAYYELIMYVPWNKTPDESFLSESVRAELADVTAGAEADCRYSLQRLEEFCRVYKDMYNAREVAPPGSKWFIDNQFAYSMYLVNQHNRDIHLDRADNNGMLKATFDELNDELQEANVDIRPTIAGVTDLSEYPVVENFLEPDMFRDIVTQPAMDQSDICVAFALQYPYQKLEEMATHDKGKRFIANPPPSSIDIDKMTPIQKFAVRMGTDDAQQVLFLCGKAGSGKTSVALKICEHYRGKVQATAYTGKAASLFNGPTIHSMFGWSHNEHKSDRTIVKPDSKKVEEFRIAHEGIELFIFEEALNIPPACYALIDETMTAAFNPKRQFSKPYTLPPFGGKRVIFLGDQAQLPPVGSSAVYEEGRITASSMQITARRDTAQSKRAKAGQLLFEKYLVPNCIYLHSSQRNTGLLGEICDRMRRGCLTDVDCTMLTFQRARFPDVVTDYGIHYQNDMCSVNNIKQQWNECKQSTPPQRMFLCKATYHVTGDNQQIVDALSTLPSQAYDYAQDILCVAENREVRLVTNINVAAGLVTSQSGRVVKVIYNNADVPLLLKGEHAVPYCIVVSFPAFQVFVEKSQSNTNSRLFPFSSQPTWVPVYRRRFAVKITALPSWIRKKQLEKDCYRMQFPLDLASNITAHRAQGQTMADCLVSVDLGLENPDMKMPPDLGPILYVACTRATKLENLFVSPIHPVVWSKIGQGDVDKYRRSVDTKLQKAAMEFAANHGLKKEMEAELSWTPDRERNAQEWRQLKQQTEPPKSRREYETPTNAQISQDKFQVQLDDMNFPMFTRPVLKERHIGIDQGVRTFAIVVTEREIGSNPKIVFADNYTQLELKTRPTASQVLIALKDKTDLLTWMNPTCEDHEVDRVVVHLEQMSIRNRNCKQLTIELGKLLQQQASDTETCVVKLSQPHVHRATGPMFQLGDEMAETLSLRPALYSKRSRADCNPAVVQDDVVDDNSDVEPAGDAHENSSHQQTTSDEYRMKKRMSSDVFRYVMESTAEQQMQMKLDVDADVQTYWKEQIHANPLTKLDDLGDALLHSLDELLCGSTNYKQLVPAAPTVHVNRTIAVAVFPDTTYWVVMNCSWNTFVLENIGSYDASLRECYYKDALTVDAIKQAMLDCNQLWTALSCFDVETRHAEECSPVDHIKVVVKQLTGYEDIGLTNVQAGALTASTTKAVKSVCDQVMGANSKLFERRDRVLGCLYVRSYKSPLTERETKMQVTNSTGKHTNAVLSCLNWMQQNLRDFVANRRAMLTEPEKVQFFDAIMQSAHLDNNRIDMLQLSPFVADKLRSQSVNANVRKDAFFKRNIADLVLIAISKNQQVVKAIAANSRKANRGVSLRIEDAELSDVET